MGRSPHEEQEVVDRPAILRVRRSSIPLFLVMRTALPDGSVDFISDQGRNKPCAPGEDTPSHRNAMTLGGLRGQAGCGPARNVSPAPLPWRPRPAGFVTNSR